MEALAVANHPAEAGCELKVSIYSGSLRRVTNHEIESSRSNLAKAAVAIQRDGNTDRGIVTGETKSTFQQAVVNFVNVQRPSGFTQNHSCRLRNRAIEKAIVNSLDIATDRRNALSQRRRRVLRKFRLG